MTTGGDDGPVGAEGAPRSTASRPAPPVAPPVIPPDGTGEGHGCTTVLVIDGHDLVGTALCLALRRAGNEAHQIVLGPHDVMLAAAGAYPPGVVLMEPAIGSATSGWDVRVPDLVAALTRTGCRVVALAGRHDGPMLGAMIMAGALGAVPKSAPLETLLTVVAAVAGHQLVMSGGDRARWLDDYARYCWRVEVRSGHVRRLSPRELQVLRLLATGHRAAVISRVLSISLSTVRTQISSLLAKLEVASQLEAVAFFHDAIADAGSIAPDRRPSEP